MITILAIDDKQNNLVVLTALFANSLPDARIITALSGREGIEKARTENPDVILLDLVMPVMDGFETCIRLKEDNLLNRIPVIMITATDVDTPTRIKGMESGAEVFLSKPIDEAELTVQVTTMVRLKKSEDHLRQENERLEALVLERTKLIEESRQAALKLLEDLKMEMEHNRLTDEALRKSEEQFRNLYNDAPVGLYRTTPAGKILLANRAIYEMLGFSNFEALSARNLEEVGFEPSYRREQFIERIEKHGEVKDLVSQWICCNGETINVRESAKVIRDADGTPIYYDGTVEDITARKKVEAALNDALVKAESGNRLKTAFMNNISHEVRTPLNGILGFSHLITQPDITDEEKVKFYSLIKTSSNRLLNTITSYMDISLIASGNMEIRQKSLDLHQLLFHLYNQFESMCLDKNIGFELSVPSQADCITLNSDAELLEKIMMHLLDNAVKFTDNGKIAFGYIFIPGSVEFYVKDTGIGISNDFFSVIFDSFKQEELSFTRGREGSGLGLSIAQGLVRLLGGNMRLESAKGSGSTFFFTLPCEGKTDQNSAPAPTCKAVPNLGSLVVLVAEDDESNSMFIKMVLRKCSIKVLSAYDGATAVRLCHDHPEISLVLMDIKMPVMDGLAATREIKSFRKTLPIIAITAFAMNGDEKKALDAGCDDYLSKPFMLEELVEKLNGYQIPIGK